MLDKIKEAIITEYKPDDKPNWFNIGYDLLLTIRLVIMLIGMVVL